MAWRDALLRFTLLLVPAAAVSAGEVINPYPRPRMRQETLVRWGFDAGTDGWQAANQAELAAADGLLKIKKAEGYLEAVADLRRGLKTCNGFALVSIEPAVRNLLLKAEHYSELAK